MTPAAILDYARDHGITMLADGDRLVIRADDDLPGELVEAARQHKPALLAELRNPGGLLHPEPGSSKDDEDIREHLEERAAIQEHDGGLSRPEAEHEARRNLRVFDYRLADNPSAVGVFISPGSTLEEARQRLARQFGKSVIEVREKDLLGVAGHGDQ